MGPMPGVVILLSNHDSPCSALQCWECRLQRRYVLGNDHFRIVSKRWRRANEIPLAIDRCYSRSFGGERISSLGKYV
jgi:hypothetical protein